MSAERGPGDGNGGVECPECGEPEAFLAFARERECPFCGTPLDQLIDVERRSR